MLQPPPRSTKGTHPWVKSSPLATQEKTTRTTGGPLPSRGGQRHLASSLYTYWVSPHLSLIPEAPLEDGSQEDCPLTGRARLRVCPVGLPYTSTPCTLSRAV